MNRLYMLIPVLAESSTAKDRVYLKCLGSVEYADVIDLFGRMKTCSDFVSDENVQCYYSKIRFDALYQHVKNKTAEYPGLSNLLQFLDDYEDVSVNGAKTEVIEVSGLKIKDDLLYAFASNDDDESSALVNRDALVKNGKSLSFRLKECAHDAVVLEVEEKSVFVWLATHRHPHRKYDKNYLKHGSKPKNRSKKGTVSAMTYTMDEAEEMLQWAVSSPNNSNKAYFWDVNKEKLIVFMYENTGIQPLYHAFEIVDANDLNAEWNKIRQQGKKKLEDKIKEVAQWRKQMQR